MAQDKNEIKIPDCGDNSCNFKGRGSGGMRTNGGCRCLNNPEGRKYVYQLHNRYVAELKLKETVNGNKRET